MKGSAPADSLLFTRGRTILSCAGAGNCGRIRDSFPAGISCRDSRSRNEL